LATDNRVKIDLMVDGGKAAPDANSSQKLATYKVNIGDVFKKINEKTGGYRGMQVPVKIFIDKDTKQFDIEVGVPPVSSLIKKEIGIEKAKLTEEDKTAGKLVLGNLKMDSAIKVAKIKMDGMLAKDLKNAVKQIVSTAGSMAGVQVEGKSAKEIIKEIEDGKWDSVLSG
jgi:large subunit ribosomal protein L11